jgi:hypothetical protein
MGDLPLHEIVPSQPLQLRLARRKGLLVVDDLGKDRC